MPSDNTDLSTKLFLVVLRPVVYSGSATLAKVLLSLYGFTRSLTTIPGKKCATVKSLLHYGVAVIQKKLGPSTRNIA